MSYLSLWYQVQLADAEMGDIIGLLTQTEFLVALKTVLAIKHAIEQTAERVVDKKFVLEMLEIMEYNIIEGLTALASSTWPYSSAQDVTVVTRRDEKTSAKTGKRAEEAPTPAPVPG